MYLLLSTPSTMSINETVEAEGLEMPFLSGELFTTRGLSWEVKDRLNKLDKLGSDCLGTVEPPERAIG